MSKKLKEFKAHLSLTKFKTGHQKKRWLGRNTKSWWFERVPFKQCPKGRIRFYSSLKNTVSAQDIERVMRKVFKGCDKQPV